jgi:hypothetical protein
MSKMQDLIGFPHPSITPFQVGDEVGVIENNIFVQIQISSPCTVTLIVRGLTPALSSKVRYKVEGTKLIARSSTPRLPEIRLEYKSSTQVEADALQTSLARGQLKGIVKDIIYDESTEENPDTNRPLTYVVMIGDNECRFRADRHPLKLVTPVSVRIRNKVRDLQVTSRDIGTRLVAAEAQQATRRKRFDYTTARDPA